MVERRLCRDARTDRAHPVSRPLLSLADSALAAAITTTHSAPLPEEEAITERAQGRPEPAGDDRGGGARGAAEQHYQRHQPADGARRHHWARIGQRGRQRWGSRRFGRHGVHRSRAAIVCYVKCTSSSVWP